MIDSGITKTDDLGRSRKFFQRSNARLPLIAHMVEIDEDAHARITC